MGLGYRSHLEAFAAAGRVHKDACCPAGAGDRQGPPTATHPTRSGMAVNVTQDTDVDALLQGRRMHHHVVCPGHNVGSGHRFRKPFLPAIPVSFRAQVPARADPCGPRAGPRCTSKPRPGTRPRLLVGSLGEGTRRTHEAGLKHSRRSTRTAFRASIDRQRKRAGKSTEKIAGAVIHSR
jgi:hypothetical protein